MTRALLFVLLGYVALVTESALKAVIASPFHLPTPEVMLLIVLYLGLTGRGSAPQMAGVALVCGYLADLFAGSPKGLCALALAIVVLAARAVSNRLMVATAWQIAAVSAAAAVGHSLILFMLSSMYADSLGALRLIPEIAFVTGLFAPPVFALLRRIDRRFQADTGRLKMAS